MLKKNFEWLRDALDNFIVAISNYIGFLQRQRVITAANHASENPARTIDQATTVKVHNKNIWVTPNDPHAFSFKIGEYRFNSGNNSYNAISIWKIDEQAAIYFFRRSSHQHYEQSIEC